MCDTFAGGHGTALLRLLYLLDQLRPVMVAVRLERFCEQIRPIVLVSHHFTPVSIAAVVKYVI